MAPSKVPWRSRFIGLLAVALVVALGASATLIRHSINKRTLDARLLSCINRGQYRDAIAAIRGGADPNSSVVVASVHPSAMLRLMTTLGIRSGAPIAVVNLVDDSALHLCSYRARVGSLEVVSALLAAGANPNKARRFDGETPLMLAAVADHSDIVRILLMHGANPNAKDPWGWTALDSAAAVGNSEEIVLLLRSGAGINSRTRDGATPLGIACDFNRVGAIRTLILHSADVNVRDDRGATLLDRATNLGNVKVASILRSFGAKPGKLLDTSPRIP